MSEMASNLGIVSVAEFVENEAILQILQDLGVDRAQAYYRVRRGPEFFPADDTAAGLQT